MIPVIITTWFGHGVNIILCAGFTLIIGRKKQPKIAKHKEGTDEELFGYTNDIFSDIPSAKPKAAKKKKKKKVASAADGKDKEDVNGTATTGAAEKVDESQSTLVHSLTPTFKYTPYKEGTNTGTCNGQNRFMEFLCVLIGGPSSVIGSKHFAKDCFCALGKTSMSLFY